MLQKDQNNKNKKAVVLAGTEDHIRLISLLKERGYYVYLIDYLENPPARIFADEHIRENALDCEKVYQIALELNADLTIALCHDQALFVMAYVSEKMRTPCYLSYKDALWLTNKSYMKKRMLECNIPTSRFQIIDTDYNQENICNDLVFPIVVKPVDSNSSNGITKVENRSKLEGAIKSAFQFSRTKNVIVEEFIHGDEYSVEFFINGSEAINVVATKTFKTDLHDNKFIILNSMCPTGLNENDMAQLDIIGKKIAEAFNIKIGPLFIQFLKTQNGLSVIEFSSRIGGGSRHHFVYHVTGFDYLEYLLALNLNEKLPPLSLKKSNNFFGCHFVYALPGYYIELEGVEKFKNEHFFKGYYPYKMPGTSITGNDSSSHRVFGFIIEAETFEEMKEYVKKVDDEVRIKDNMDNDLMIHSIYYK